ncbi:MAG: CBS domain-containing protein, partial [Methanobacterium sp.]
DWLYPPAQSKEIVMALTANNIDVSYHELKSSYGHDAFLLEEGQLNYIISGFLSDILVRDVMTNEVSKISEELSIDEAARLMLEEKVTHLPVVSNEDKLIGIVTAWDISKAVALKCDKLEDIMTKEVIISSPNDQIEITAEKMREYNISSLPVVDDYGRVIGIITTDHISTLITRD